MCGRYTLTQPGRVLGDLFGLDDLPDMPPRYNIAPGQPVPAIVAGQSGACLTHLKWGLIPHWANDPRIGNRLINARSESAGQKPAFRDAFQRRRCVLPADGFFEWHKSRQRKQPHYIFLQEHKGFPLAGLWDTWESPQGEAIHSCTILTCQPNETVRPLHNRMPVILPLDAWRVWISEDTEPDRAASLLAPYPAEQMSSRPVSTIVNSPAHDSPACIQSDDAPA